MDSPTASQARPGVGKTIYPSPEQRPITKGSPPGGETFKDTKGDAMSEQIKSAEAESIQELKFTIGSAGTALKEGLAGTLKGISEVEAEIVSLARNTLSTTHSATVSVTSEGLNVIKDMLKRALAESQEMDTDIAVTIKNVAKGIILGAADVGADLGSAARLTIKEALSGAAEIGVDVGTVARRAIEGILEATREVGGNVEDVARVISEEAIESAGTIGEAAVKTVKNLTIGIVAGIKEIIEAALLKSPSIPETKELDA